MSTLTTRLIAVVSSAALWSGCANSSDALPATAPAVTESTPAVEAGACGIEGGGCAPYSARVDVLVPRFSHPTEITNPLHPSAATESVLMLGKQDGAPLRVEVTLLPDTKTIRWNGEEIETLETQYVAYLDGRIKEVALDWYAQADDGGVWYFGEDVFNYEDGDVADTEGTWLAGQEGPPGLIMPADPQAGDVYRPENVAGLVFEEVTVRSVGASVDGPSGPVNGVLEVEEVHQDGARELKTFAPGYGEFSTGVGDNIEAVALAVPADVRGEPLPPELARLMGAARRLSELGSDNLAEAASIADALTAEWEPVVDATPPLLATQMADALANLASSLTARNDDAVRRAALDVRQAVQDLTLMYLPRNTVDLGRMETAARLTLLDAAAKDSDALKGDASVLEVIWARVVSSADASTKAEVESALGSVRIAADTSDYEAAETAAEGLIALLSAAVPNT